MRPMMSSILNKPGIFVQVLNPMTGKMEWKNQPEDYDYQQELARAAFADMLHDSERNKMYYEGVKSAIAKKRSLGQPVHVLDIGTGTGLLSMMAARIGADSITAIEEFLPMANRAERIIRENGFEDQIKLVRKRSTSVKVGPGLDMDQRANILVTEVFDTELIGEGAIGTFNHAHDCLLTQDCLVVPHSGRVYAQVVSSDLCSKWNGLHDIKGLVKIPDHVRGSGAQSLALHDLQLSQFEEAKGHFKVLSKPLKIFDFDFGKLTGNPIELRRQSIVEFEMKSKSKCDAVFLWWDLIFDPENQIVLTCAPTWAQHGNIKDMAWRDHWMQAIYYPISKPDPCDKMFLTSNHDEYSYWFDISTEKPTSQIEMPHPQSGIHLAVSRTRLGQLNDQDYNAKLTKATKTLIDEKRKSKESVNVLILSEQSLLPLIASKFLNETRDKVIHYELNDHFRHALNSISQENQLHNILEVRKDVLNYSDITSEIINHEVDIILAEPFFNISLVPWHNLFFWYMLKSVKRSVDILTMPIKATIWACPVTFSHLWKIRAPLNIVEGFDLSHFDEVIMNACDVSDAEVEPQPLWEYPCYAEDIPREIMTFDFTKKDVENKKTTVKFENLKKLVKRGAGMAFWMEWCLTEEISVNTGPVEDIQLKKQIKWDMHHKQGVHFFVEKDENVCISDIEVETTFKDGDLMFKFVTE